LVGGVIGTLTQNDARGGRENENFARAAELATGAWQFSKPDWQPVIERTLPRRVAFSDVAGNDVAYLTTEDANLRTIMHTLFRDMSSRIGLI
jgi:hypothetical protein